MRIRRYPGKAVDASLSLEQSNAMETIYKNNWLNAHETIRSNGTAFANDYHSKIGHSPMVGFDSVVDEYSTGVSSLGKYQMTLEQIRQLELKNKDPSVTQAIKDLSGYKPSTLRRKNRRNYPGWDDLIETERNVADHLDEQANGRVYNYSQFDIKEQSEPVKNVSKSRQHKGSTRNADERQQRPANGDTPTYANVESIKLEAKAQSKLRRSHTLKESSAASFCSTLDIKDIFRRCPQSKGDQCDKDLSRRNASSSSSGNSSANSSTKSSTDMTTALLGQPNRIAYNCDRNSRTISIEPSYSQGRTTAVLENAPPNRMSISYNTDAILPPPAAAQKSKSIARAKSVRIQNPSFSTQWDESPIMTAPRPSKPPPSPPIRRNASSSRQQSPPSPNSKFNTVSAAGTRQRNNNLPTSVLVTTASPDVPTIITTTLPVPVIKPILKHVQIVDRAEQCRSRQTSNQMIAVVANTATVQQQPRRKPASSSSVDSDEMFSIPRPRLIVPVHTYARKRRTGNLLSAQADDIMDDDDEMHDNGKG